jgi:hypothetical protein
VPAAITAALGSGSYNGLAWGPGTKYHINKIAGAADMPGIRATDSLRAYQHGHFRGVDLSAGRVVDITFAIVGDDNPDYLNLVGALETATVLQSSAELPLLLYGSTRRINCRPRKRAIAYDAGQYQRTGTVDVQFVSSDPRVYDANLTTLAIPVSVSSGGAAWPWVWPVAWGTAGTLGVANAVNNGNFPTRPVAVIAGPVDNPQLQNAATGQYVQFAITLGVSDTLTVDFDAHSVLLNGTASRRSTMVSGSQWWELAPGTTQILYSANTVQVGSFATITFRSAWL